MYVYVESLLIVLAMFSVVFIIAQILRNNSIVDIFWGLSYVLLASYFFLRSGTQYSLILIVLVSAWGLRLSGYLFIRNKGVEDFRYKEFRKNWGRFFIVKAYFKIFVLQAILMFIISLPIIFMMNNELVNLSVFTLGMLVWLIGYLIEVVSDQQMRTFKRINKGLIDVGLWRVSRHPNYFGEIVIWVGFFVMSLGYGSPLWLIVSPLCIYSIFQFITIPMLEKKYDNREDYQVYKETTNKLLPIRRK